MKQFLVVQGTNDTEDATHDFASNRVRCLACAEIVRALRALILHRQDYPDLALESTEQQFFCRETAYIPIRKGARS